MPSVTARVARMVDDVARALSPGRLPWRTRPRLVMIELTNLCNLRCYMCGIWEETPKRTIDLAAFERIVSRPPVRNARVLALTGGEPFMIRHFDDYYAVARVRSPRSHVNVSTNGYYTERTLAFLERADRDRTSLTISYDGVRSHDLVRGVAGSQARLLATATAVRRRFPEVGLSLKLTVTNDNYAEILDTALQCRDLGIAFRMKTLEKLRCHQGRFPSPVTGPEYDERSLAAITAQGRAVLGLGIETNRRYIAALLEKTGGGVAPCTCSPRTVFVGVDGDVFLCRRMDPIGNLGDAPLAALWRSERKVGVVREMSACRGAALGLGFTHA
jgi:MoaA/NifB/PqqE/SkfB family radical SAM enzyme